MRKNSCNEGVLQTTHHEPKDAVFGGALLVCIVHNVQNMYVCLGGIHDNRYICLKIYDVQ